jgi:hypothetical protein
MAGETTESPPAMLLSVPAGRDDLTGRGFGRWVVLGYADGHGNQYRWLCRCDCGVERRVYQSHLLRGKSLSCGCRRKEFLSQGGAGYRKDLTDQKFGRLTVVSIAPPKNGRPAWNCVCECGETRVVYTFSLTSGNTQSCGCLAREKARQKFTKHGLCKDYKDSPEYTAWVNMIDRCYNPDNESYANYGGRGITVCTQWRNSPKTFIADMGSRPSDRHSVDRLDNRDGGEYSPENCKWRTMKEQGRNRRSNHLVEFRDERRCIAEWAEITGLNWSTIFRRLERGWPPERALTTMVKQ